uniref:Protein tweety homolog n=1 Tax=Esox lucius TaxID=8010 RepID=A0A6Q2XZW7_ESOLU
MATARLDYVAPWWTYWMHNFPHFNLSFQPVENTFRPEEANYQQSLVFLACMAAAGLALSVLLLSTYLTCLCCCRREEEGETKRPDSCCVSWTAVVSGLVICSAVGVGFYGNSETNDGVYQLTYSLHNANHTLGGINNLVSSSLDSIEVVLQQHLNRLDEIFAKRGDYIQSLRFMGQMADNIIRQLSAVPDLGKANVDLSYMADQAAYVEYYRWLTYLLLLILDLVICLVACLGVAKQSKWLLITYVPATVSRLGVLVVSPLQGTSDFCVSPDKFIVNRTKSFLMSHYYLYCSPSLPNPFQQSLTIFQRSLTTMQIQTQGLLQYSVPLFPTAERDLLGIQRLLNSTEFNLHQLTALLDCRSLHKDYFDALMGVCYDGVEGLLYLGLFSLLSVCAFCALLCTVPRAWTVMASRERDYDDIDEEDPFNPQSRRVAYNPSRASHVHSFCSYTSSLGSQTSLHPPPQVASNLPTSEYMNQSMLFGGNPRYENVPLIGGGSPPPMYSPSMKTTYQSMTDAQMRQFGAGLQQV